jgi:hypothetical protein
MFRKVLLAAALAVGSLLVTPTTVGAAPDATAKVANHHSQAEAQAICGYIAMSEYGGLAAVRLAHWDFLWNKWYAHCRFDNLWVGGCFEDLFDEATGQLIHLGGVSCTAVFP